MRLFKKIPLILGFCITISVFAPASAYAAENNQLDSMITQIKEAPNQTEEEAKAKCIRVGELLKEKMDADAFQDDPTVEGGYKIIDEILKDSQVNLGDGVELSWKKYFKQEAMALGVNFDSAYATITDESGTEVGSYKDTSAGNSDAEAAGIKTNILTWNKTTDQNGNALSKANQGMVSKLLTSVSENMKDFSDNIRAFAIALAITFGAVGMMNMIQDKNASNEALSREFIKLMIGVWFIYNYKFFALLIIRAGTLLLEGVMTGVHGSSGNAVEYAITKSFLTVCGSGNVTEITSKWYAGIGAALSDAASSLSGIFGSITGLFGNGIVQIASSLVIYAVVIELVVRYLFTPLAIADLYSEKWRSNGWMWLKKLFAVSMQGAVIFLIIYVTDIFKDGLGASFSVITNTAINLTMIGMFAKSRQIANDIIGVH
ncbi:MAG: hypothetical protein V8S93_02135 [Lachnospiraceae bacterium]